MVEPSESNLLLLNFIVIVIVSLLLSITSSEVWHCSGVILTKPIIVTIITIITSCKYPSSGQSKLSRFALEFSRPLRASVRSFISIHQVAPYDLDLDLD